MVSANAVAVAFDKPYPNIASTALQRGSGMVSEQHTHLRQGARRAP